MLLLRASFIATIVLLTHRSAARQASARLLAALSLAMALFMPHMVMPQPGDASLAWAQGLPDLAAAGEPDPDRANLAVTDPAVLAQAAADVPSWLAEPSEKDPLASVQSGSPVISRPPPPARGPAIAPVEGFLLPPLRPPKA